jgi:hypothetical protein
MLGLHYWFTSFFYPEGTYSLPRYGSLINTWTPDSNSVFASGNPTHGIVLHSFAHLSPSLWSFSRARRLHLSQMQVSQVSYFPVLHSDYSVNGGIYNHDPRVVRMTCLNPFSIVSCDSCHSHTVRLTTVFSVLYSTLILFWPKVARGWPWMVKGECGVLRLKQYQTLFQR